MTASPPRRRPGRAAAPGCPAKCRPSRADAQTRRTAASPHRHRRTSPCVTSRRHQSTRPGVTTRRHQSSPLDVTLRHHRTPGKVVPMVVTERIAVSGYVQYLYAVATAPAPVLITHTLRQRRLVLSPPGVTAFAATPQPCPLPSVGGEGGLSLPRIPTAELCASTHGTALTAFQSARLNFHHRRRLCFYLRRRRVTHLAAAAAAAAAAAGSSHGDGGGGVGSRPAWELRSQRRLHLGDSGSGSE